MATCPPRRLRPGHATRTIAARVVVPAACLLLSLLSPGCSESPVSTAPEDSALRAARAAAGAGAAPRSPESPRFADGRERYPLAIGNRWHLHRDLVARFYDGAGTLFDSVHLTVESERVMECLRAVDGREYFIEHVVEYYTLENNHATDHYWTAYRQDPAALYEYDRRINSGPCEATDAQEVMAGLQQQPHPPGASDPVALFERRLGRGSIAHARKFALVNRIVGARGGAARSSRTAPDPGGTELLRLPYPLHPGQSWTVGVIGDGSPLRATVEAPDAIDTADGREPGWRIRYDWTGAFGPEDRMHVWYGRGGYLGMNSHIVTADTDPSGNVTGTRVVDIDERLVDKLLVTR